MRSYLSEEKQKSKKKRLITDLGGEKKNTGSKGLARNLHTVCTAQPSRREK